MTEADAPDESAPPGYQWRISRVSGRGSDDSRGLPPMSDVTLEGPNGETMKFGRIQKEGLKSSRAMLLGVPPFTRFSMCPICGSEEEPTAEHVPQGGLGGKVMTVTCHKCNSDLGSRVETVLLNWFDDAVDEVRFSGGGVQGRRRVPRLLLRETPAGEPVLMNDTGKVDPAFDTMLASGNFNVEFVEPPKELWVVAALKHAYLGACLCLGGIPASPLSHQVRTELVAARDSRRGMPFPESMAATNLRVHKSNAEGAGPAVALVALIDDDGGIADVGISLAGTLFVSWPLEVELLNAAIRRFRPLVDDASEMLIG